jgi:membrane protein YqaA with SNARE-associated domain
MKESLLATARGPNALRALAFISFIESSVFPLPPDIMLAPMVLANRQRWALIAFVCTIASVIGGLAGYAIGFFAWRELGMPLLSFFYGAEGVNERFLEFQSRVLELGFWPQFLGVFGAGVTPFPYKVITIASGTLSVPLHAFVIASILSRGIRFFGVALVLYVIGESARDVIEKRFGLIMTAFFLLIVAGFVALRVLH